MSKLSRAKVTAMAGRPPRGDGSQQLVSEFMATLYVRLKHKADIMQYCNYRV